jgi:hypothetical protein
VLSHFRVIYERRRISGGEGGKEQEEEKENLKNVAGMICNRIYGVHLPSFSTR